MTETVNTTCCIVGGGPAGMMLGFLLARAGVDVAVLEKYPDFFRDFRGDTIHPSTLELMYELGLLDEFLKLPHQDVRQMIGQIGQTEYRVADLTHLPTHCKYIALMPQWDFLNFLARQAAPYKTFRLMMQTEGTDLITENGRVVGCRAAAPTGPVDIRADLVVGSDGRHSTVREKAGFVVEDLGAPMDVFWMRISRKPEDGLDLFGRLAAGHVLIMLDRGDFWQCAFLIPKGAADTVRQQGLPRFQAMILALAPQLGDRVKELDTWDKVKFLSVAVDRLRQWYRPGLLCIGDSAHAMSPIGGIGVNLAVQDAVATANLLWRPLRERTLTTADLAAVERRRAWPARVTQRFQIMIQNKIVRPVLASTQEPKAPLAVRLLNRFPLLQRIPARIVGMGVRPEHIHSPQAGATAP